MNFEKMGSTPTPEKTPTEAADRAKGQFPDNQRGQELAQKESLRTLSEEERAELMAMRQFPDNQRGRELAQKEVLSTLNEDELTELIALRRLERGGRDDAKPGMLFDEDGKMV